MYTEKLVKQGNRQKTSPTLIRESFDDITRPDSNRETNVNPKNLTTFPETMGK